MEPLSAKGGAGAPAHYPLNGLPGASGPAGTNEQ